MWTLGIHCGKHNSSICLLKDGPDTKDLIAKQK